MPPTIRVGPGDYFGHGPGFFLGHPLVGGLIAVLVIALLVALAVGAVAILLRGRSAGATRHPIAPRSEVGPPANDEALRILNERFARGEIDAGEYTQRRDLLKQSA